MEDASTAGTPYSDSRLHKRDLARRIAHAGVAAGRTGRGRSETQENGGRLFLLAGESCVSAGRASRGTFETLTRFASDRKGRAADCWRVAKLRFEDRYPAPFAPKAGTGIAPASDYLLNVRARFSKPTYAE
jgi:hypothetical protein